MSIILAHGKCLDGACNDRLFTSFKIAERKKAANLSLFSTSSKWIYNKRSECRQLIKKFRKRFFFSVRVKFKSSRGQVSVLFWAFVWFFSCHRRPDDCLFTGIWILKKANPDIISIKQQKMIFECFAFHYSLFSRKEHHSFLSSLFISSVSSRFISFVIPPKNMIHSISCLLSNPLQSHCFQIQYTAYRSGLCIKQVYFVLSKR